MGNLTEQMDPIHYSNQPFVSIKSAVPENWTGKTILFVSKEHVPYRAVVINEAQKVVKTHVSTGSEDIMEYTIHGVFNSDYVPSILRLSTDMDIFWSFDDKVVASEEIR